MSSRSFRCKNPGNIVYGPFAQRCGATEGDGKFAKFIGTWQGFRALAWLICGPNYNGLTLLDAFKRYAPATDDNIPEAYAKFVAKKVGVSIDTRINQLDPFQLADMIKAIVQYEGWKE